MKKITIALSILTVWLSINALAADSVISDVTVRQRWPWSKLVDIDYVLDCDAPVDIVISGYNGSTELTLPELSLSGDLHNVASGARRIVWDPTLTGYANQEEALLNFHVTLTPTPMPLYMILDLTKEAGETNQIEYIYEDALTNGVWGAWDKTLVTNAGTVVESLIWTGVTTNDIYKTDKLALRRISSGTFGMGEETSPKSVILTKSFYAGVFDVTQQQWHNVMGGQRVANFNDEASKAYRPMEMISYDDIRGSAAQGGGDWPTNANVYSESFVGIMRTKTQFNGFDLPTAAQWEYACRAGTDTCFHDGNPNANVNGANAETNAWLDALGRYKFNGGFLEDGVTEPASDCGATNGTAIVGSYAPNAWGLYDMHGNVWELCLDWYNGQYYRYEGVDPRGPDTGEYRLGLGGSWSDKASNCRPISIRGNSPGYRFANGLGFRLVRTLP